MKNDPCLPSIAVGRPPENFSEILLNRSDLQVMSSGRSLNYQGHMCMNLYIYMYLYVHTYINVCVCVCV